ncbi:Casparian strip membrane protein domain-containing protein [Hirschfeldia incana]|nr:Casparian strip membrane protein domain-containing protein [Hirschfeldia incana]
MRDTNNTREGERNGSSKLQPQEAPMSLKLIDSCLRLSVIPLSVATISLTVTIHQSNPDYGNLDYNSIMGLKYMVGVSAICGIYALFSTISSWVTCLVSKAWLFFVPDQVFPLLKSNFSALFSSLSLIRSCIRFLIQVNNSVCVKVLAYLMTTSVAGATEIVYLLNKGDKTVTWSEVCSSYPHFCLKLTIALGLHVFVLFSFLFLSVISAYRAFSVFDPPCDSQTNGNA